MGLVVGVGLVATCGLFWFYDVCRMMVEQVMNGKGLGIGLST